MIHDGIHFSNEIMSIIFSNVGLKVLGPILQYSLHMLYQIHMKCFWMMFANAFIDGTIHLKNEEEWCLKNLHCWSRHLQKQRQEILKKVHFWVDITPFYQYYKWVLFLQKGKKSIIVQHFSLCCWYKNWILF